MENNRKHPISFKHLIDLLAEDNELDEDVEDLTNADKTEIDVIDRHRLSKHIIEEGSNQEAQPYKFPYDDYKIVGDTANIDKIIHTWGFINIDVADITSTLSKDTLNYVTVGAGDNITDAFEQSVENLPITTDNVERMLFQILIPNGLKPDINSMTEFICKYGADIDVFWGIAYDESLADSIKVILIASSK